MKYCLIRRFASAGCMLAVLAAVVGCPPGKPVMRDIPPPPPPPAVPIAQPTALDPALRQSAREMLLAGLTDPKKLTRANCLEAISEVAATDPHGPDYAPAVIAALHDPSDLVRFSAAMTIGRLKLQAAHQSLLDDLLDPSIKVRVAVHFALHMLGDKRYSHDLEAYARNPADPTVRVATAEVLGMMNEPSATKILLPMQHDHDARVRQEAAQALWCLGNSDGKGDLIAMTVSSYPDDRMIGILGLAEPRNTEARDFIVGSLTTAWLEVNLVAARAMGMLGSDAGYTIAIRGADTQPTIDDQDHVREAAHDRFLAALALGAIGRSDAQPTLAKLLKDPSAAVQVAAATAILQLHD